MCNDNYVKHSLELHLFFGRIMKEHSLFLKAGFTPVNAAFANKAEFYKKEFEKLLCQALMLADGIVSREVLCSGELVTEFTALAEQQTERFTGIRINKGITEKELRLQSNACTCNPTREQRCQVQRLNRTALQLLDGLIALKESILEHVLRCEMFTMNYPLLLEHIIREAKLYRQYVQKLEQTGDLPCESMREMECFWNRIMMEHAMFIRGLLDPSEEKLFRTADGFAQDYSKLLEACNCAQERTMAGTMTGNMPGNMAGNSLEETLKFREFKMAGAKGIQQCQIRSVILPLLADHVLREANHYIRLLKA